MGWLCYGLHNVVAIAAGGEHSLALKADGTVVAWGRGTEGQTTIPAGLNDVVAMAGGECHSLFLQATGTVEPGGSGSAFFARAQIPARVGYLFQTNNAVVLAELGRVGLHDKGVELSGARALLTAVLELGMPYTLERDEVLRGFLYGSESLMDLDPTRVYLEAENARLRARADARPLLLGNVAALRYQCFVGQLNECLTHIAASGQPETPRLVGHTLRLLNLLRDAWTPAAPLPGVEIARVAGNALQGVVYGEPFTHYAYQWQTNHLSVSGATNLAYTHATGDLPPGLYSLVVSNRDSPGPGVTANYCVGSVAITSPTNGQRFVPGSPITIHVATPQYFCGTVTNVAFLDDGRLIGNDTSEPFSLDYTNASTGLHTLRVVATDDLGNSATSEWVAIQVCSGIVISCPNDLVLACAGPSGTIVQFTAYATDTCGGTNVPVVCTPPSGSTYPLGTHTVACVATNQGGETALRTFAITIFDEPPQITCPSDFILIPDPGRCARSNVIYTVSAIDLCAGTNVSLVCDPPSGSTFALGRTLVTCWATDPAGNSNRCTFTVTVRNCGPNPCADFAYTIRAGPGQNWIANQLDHGSNTLAEILTNVPAGTVLSRFDSCQQAWIATATNATGSAWAPASVTLLPGEGALLQIPSNQPPAQLTFTGRPRCAPVLPVRLVQGFQLVSCQLPEVGTFASIVGVPPIDGAWILRATEGGNGYQYSEGYGWLDDFGNVVEPTAEVGEAWVLFWPEGNQPPLLSCPPMRVSPDPGQCYATVAYAVSAFDNVCGGVQLVYTPPNGSQLQVGTTTAVTCVATDAAGNVSRCDFTVFVKDLEIARMTNAIDTNIIENVVTWPNCLGMRLQFADALGPDHTSTPGVDVTTVWRDLPGATSPYTDQPWPWTGYRARLTCDQVVPPAWFCTPLPGWGYNGHASCRLDNTNLLTIQLTFWTLGAANAAPLVFSIWGPAGLGANAPSMLYDCSTWPVAQAPDGWYYTGGSLGLVDNTGGFSLVQQVGQLQGGQWYLIVGDTLLAPDGEIRGQIQPLRSRFFRLVKP